MTELRQRRQRIEDPQYLARLRELPCVVCGYGGDRSDAAHIRMSDAAWGGYWDKRSTGMQEKPDDRWAVPLCRPRYRPDPVARILKPDKALKLQHVGCHGLQHGHSIRKIRELLHDDDTGMKLEEAFWRSTGKNPFMIAAVLYEKFGTVKDGQEAVYRKPRSRPKRAKPASAHKAKIPSRPFPKTGRKIASRKRK